MSSSIGSVFKVTTFGESHGAAVGVVVGLRFQLTQYRRSWFGVVPDKAPSLRPAVNLTAWYACRGVATTVVRWARL